MEPILEDEQRALKRIEEKACEQNGLRVRVTLLTDPDGVDPLRWNQTVRVFALFTNLRDTRLTLNLRDVHGFGNGRLNLVYVAPLDVIGPGGSSTQPLPPGGAAQVPVFTMPPAPCRWSGKNGLVLLEPGGTFEHRFYLVTPFYRPPVGGKWRLEFAHLQPTYQGTSDEEPGTQWVGALRCAFPLEWRDAPQVEAVGAGMPPPPPY